MHYIVKYLFCSESKKLCKKLKISSDNPYYIKHYKDGEFNKDYDRGMTVSSLSNFLRDPSGDLPWDEDPAATDIFHLADGEVRLILFCFLNFYCHLVLKYGEYNFP